jgi:hypothetical protein
MKLKFYDTRTGCCRQGGMKHRRQGKMAEEVRREPHLPAPWRSVEILQSHNPDIVDQDLQRSSPVGAEPSHRSQIRNVQSSDLDGVVACRNPDVFRNSACRSRPPHCERDCRTGSTERLRCLETDAGGPTCTMARFPLRSTPSITSAAVEPNLRFVVIRPMNRYHLTSVRAKLTASDALTLGPDRLDPIRKHLHELLQEFRVPSLTSLPCSSKSLSTWPT